ncbi:uncharacterized protein LOC122080099 isoform X2 [Macadamia integrifolia]|uniref:uncharacterized protein LOC122080099 isoform X2 n=1 Tax=Macadamia integrifolia TaxID=60698 RepID=UPI001C4EED1C|nr:uncharacterized protein LOC122080099 isoform X2 [Macadamia integrifolia]
MAAPIFKTMAETGIEIELEPRVKPLPYKIKGMSRESPSQKAVHILDPDLRSHWSAGTNTKEWILLELDEPCLLSQIRIYNKSVLEWEIAVGLRYKPEAFIKVRPRCEAPRRDMVYPMNYTPCRYVRISCLRGNPIALFFIQLIGVSVIGLEPEFQPVVSHLLPHIISHKQDANNMHLQLLQDVTKRLNTFLPQLESEFASFPEAAETNLRFLAMLSGPFYPILHIVNERETVRASGNISDSDTLKNSQASTLTVSSNFEAQPRRSRSPLPFVQPASCSVVFRPDTLFVLLRKAYKDSHLGTVCRVACRVLQKLIGPIALLETSTPSSELTSSVSDEILKAEGSNNVLLADYSNLFGDEFKIPDDNWDTNYLNLLDIGAVEEGILHVLNACASQSLLCAKLAESSSNLWSVLPLVQALLPALRPLVSSTPDQIDDNLMYWKQSSVQHACSQIVVTSSSSVYRPLLHACAGYLSSFLPSHAKSACVLIDLCLGPLAPWIPTIIAKVDLAIELMEDLLGMIQGARFSITRARAALKYVILALSGHMDDILSKYKEVKHKVLFLVEMLEPFLDPAITAMKNTIAFGDVSAIFLEKQEQNCAIALNVIRASVDKPAVLPSLEAEWRRGSVAPSVLLSILGPHLPLPPEIDLCKCPVSKSVELESSAGPSVLSIPHHGVTSLKSNGHDESDGRTDVNEATSLMDALEDVNLLFGPPELKSITLRSVSNIFDGNSPDKNSSESIHAGNITEGKQHAEKILSNQFQNCLTLDSSFAIEYLNLESDCLQLIDHRESELKASEFQRLALDLHSHHDITLEGHDAAIDALLLAAECYVNPFFMTASSGSTKVTERMNVSRTKIAQKRGNAALKRVSDRDSSELETISDLESKRDKIVLQILLEAAELDKEYQLKVSTGVPCLYNSGRDEQVIKLFPQDLQSADAVTFVRQNQALLCNFLIQRLQREHSMHEILLQSLLFLFHSATELCCPPENVVDVILGSAEYLNGLLTSFYYSLKDGNLQLDAEKIYGVQRRWMILQRLVIASSGGGDGREYGINFNCGFQYRSLIPPSSWMQRIPKFSNSPSPLVRFLGWMAVSRYAKQFLKEQLFLASDLSQLTSLLSIFADDLSLVDNIVDKKNKDIKSEVSGAKQNTWVNKGLEFPDQPYGDGSFHFIYPDLHKFFPNMKMQFEAFGEIILEAVGLQLKLLPSSSVPDLLCWFSDLCLWPFLREKGSHSMQNYSEPLKGYAAKNAKAIILYILEAIVLEHMEAMVPELPRVVQVIASLCGSSYCDVSFLDSILRLLKPLISYALRKVSIDEKLLTDESSCLNFEALCFDELFCNIKQRSEYLDSPMEKVTHNCALTIFVLGAVFPDLSFQHQREVLQSLALWADFSSFEATTAFYDYLCAFQNVMQSCQLKLVKTLGVFGFLTTFQKPYVSGMDAVAIQQNNPDFHAVLDGSLQSSISTKISENIEGTKDDDAFLSNQKVSALSVEEVEEFSECLEGLISKLYPTIELCWKLHHQLSKKLTLTSAECFMYSRCLLSIVQKSPFDGDIYENLIQHDSIDQFTINWRSGIEGFAGAVVSLQENQCWQVASVMLDYLLGLPHCFCLDNVIGTVCFAIKHFCCSAPKLSWRLQTDKWLSLLFKRGIGSIQEDKVPLVDMFFTMLGHPEPEQRSIALQTLRRLVGSDGSGGAAKFPYTLRDEIVASDLVFSISETILSHLVSTTWDRVATLASSDESMLLRAHATALLVDYIPFVDHSQLQSFLGAADSVLCGLGKLAFPVFEGPLARLSVTLLANACLYCPVEDVALIPQSVWKNIEAFGMSKAGRRLGEFEKICQALFKLKMEGDDAKEVVSDLTHVRSYFDIFSKRIDQEDIELEEAEIEIDLLHKEHALQELSGDRKEDTHQSPISSIHIKDGNRLQQIKDQIRSLEKSRLREEIVARRQKKLLVRHARQKYLEETALREAELLQELDRERTSEVEHEIERLRLLEIERARTRELRHNLDLEKERQTQRELQRELEQVESGVRPSRRDFSSSVPSSRPRERYRERENGRSGNEGSLRPGSSGRESGGMPPAMTSNTSSSMTTGMALSMPTVVLAGSRQFSGQLPTILQSRDRQDERGNNYDENFDGSKDSGDTGSVGDSDLASAFDGQSGGYSSQRHGSRGSKSRQIVERRERDGRREGKWERKHL